MHARLLYASLLTLTLSTAISAATIPVSTTSDSIDTDGSCSLREAIIAANTNTGGITSGECPAGDPAGQDQIVFDIPGGGLQQIFVQSALPAIVSSVSIDGYTQPGSSPNTLAELSGFNAVLMIEINGTQSGPTTKQGLMINGSNASNSSIRGVRITGFTTTQCCADVGIEVKGSGLTQVQIAGNRIDGNKQRGIFVSALGNSHTGLKIGGPLPADRNAVYGATAGQAIMVDGCNQCVIQNNWIGIAPDAGGLPTAGNQSLSVMIANSTGVELIGNWIGAGSTMGLLLATGVEGTLVQDNLVGGSLPNGVGVALASNNLGISAGARLLHNQITGNTGVGLLMTNTLTGIAMRGNRLTGNRIFGNGGLEIDLGADGGGADGISANDPGDSDAGPNSRQNYPVLSAVNLGSGLSTVDYAVDSEAGSYDIELVFSTACDPSGHGPAGQILAEPMLFEGQLDQGSLIFPTPVSPGSGYVSAIASVTDLGTSEYSACVPYSYSDELLRNGFE